MATETKFLYVTSMTVAHTAQSYLKDKATPVSIKTKPLLPKIVPA